MNIQIDSREKAKAIKGILTEFNHQGVDYYVSKLYVGDYMNLDNPRLIIDRKQNLIELCNNVCQDHDRFRNELIRANEAGIDVIILCEHGKGIERLEDVIWWDNPRRHKRIQDPETRKWKDITTKAITGEKLYKILLTLQRKYQCRFEFCNREETGKRIIDLLGGVPGDGRGD
ncbi:ERCC4 domain-containing protein [Lacrimispora sp.]|uniref:ERCC4 domain-containing protein n=1 Tax=Lacrimispora sp. TaxID=2719234 RepID=UPI002FDB83E9